MTVILWEIMKMKKPWIGYDTGIIYELVSSGAMPPCSDLPEALSSLLKEYENPFCKLYPSTM